MLIVLFVSVCVVRSRRFAVAVVAVHLRQVYGRVCSCVGLPEGERHRTLTWLREQNPVC